VSENLPPCEFRHLRDDVYRCGAANDAWLGPEGGELVQRICGSCSVPPILASDRSCLYLIAWTEIVGEQSEGKFACRIFHPLYDEPWKHNTVCATCPFWHPRPPLPLIKDHAEWIERMKRFYTEEGLAADRERRRQEVGDWRPGPIEEKPGLLRRLLRGR
jgi:hypothetical protein